MNIKNLLLIMLVGLSVESRAGVLIPKNGEPRVGDLKLEKEMLLFSFAKGQVAFQKSEILWYATDASINTFLKAANKAKSSNESSVIIRKLLEASIREELATRSEAQKMLAGIQQEAMRKAENQAAQAIVREPLNIVPSDVKMYKSTPNATVNLSLDQTNFEGFMTYNSYGAVSTPTGVKVITFPIRVPIFSKKHLETTVDVATGETPSVIRVSY